MLEGFPLLNSWDWWLRIGAAARRRAAEAARTRRRCRLLVVSLFVAAIVSCLLIAASAYAFTPSLPPLPRTSPPSGTGS